MTTADPNSMNTPETQSAVRSSGLLGVGIEHSNGSVVCAACGYEAEWEECNACGGEGGHDGYEEDPLWYQPGEIATCCQCSGAGGEWWCENSKCETQNIRKFRKAKPTPNNQAEPLPPDSERGRHSKL